MRPISGRHVIQCLGQIKRQLAFEIDNRSVEKLERRSRHGRDIVKVEHDKRSWIARARHASAKSTKTKERPGQSRRKPGEYATGIQKRPRVRETEDNVPVAPLQRPQYARQDCRSEGRVLHIRQVARIVTSKNKSCFPGFVPFKKTKLPYLQYPQRFLFKHQCTCPAGTILHGLGSRPQSQSFPSVSQIFRKARFNFRRIKAGARRRTK